MAFLSNPYYSVITIDHTLVGGALTDYVLYLDDLPADAYAEIHSTGKDIRFSDSTGVTELAFDIRALNTGAGTCEIMVKVPSVSAVTDTDIRIWYGDHTLTAYDPADTYGRNAVYSLFEAVFSLQEDLSGATAAPIYIDRTGNGYSGKDYVDATGKTGQVGSGQEFDGSNDYIEFSADWQASLPCTMLSWVNTDTVATTQMILSTDNFTNGIRYILLNGQLGVQYFDGTSNFRRKLAPIGSVISAGVYSHVAAVVRGAVDMSLYVNGLDVGGAYAGTGGTLSNTATVPRIGIIGGSLPYDGLIDELWISESDIGGPYISTLYENQSAAFGAFYTVSAKVSTVTFTPILTWF